MKAIVVCVALALVTAVAWRYKDAGPWQGMAGQEAQAPPALKFDNGSSMAPAGEPAQEVRPGRTGIHKCKKGSTVTYTDAPCEQRKQEQALAGGTVTVVKGQRPVAEAPAASASQALLRTLAGDPNEPSLKDKAIERAIDGQ